MKKYLFLSLLICVLSLVSCNQTDTREEVTTVVKNTTTTITEPGTDGFLLKKQVVVHGNTVWGFTQKVYGTGTNWREVVSQNPFLQQPGRVYYDDAKKMWVVLIYPGEVLKLGGEVISPTYVVEETTTTTTVKTSDPNNSVIPWWGWVLIAALIIWLLLNLINSFRPGFLNRNSNSLSSSAIYVSMSNHCDIDTATRAALLARNQDSEDKVLDIIKRDARKNGRLTEWEMNKTSDSFSVKTKYSERFGPKNEKQTKTEEDKK